MDSANINTAEQNIAQVKTALKAFVEMKDSENARQGFCQRNERLGSSYREKSEEPFTLVILGEFKGEKAPL